LGTHDTGRRRFFYCLRPVSYVPNVVSVPSVLSKVYCFFVVFVLCRVCPMLPVSLLFCLMFIVFSIRQNRRGTGNIGHIRHRTKTIEKTINIRQNRRDTVLCRVCSMLSVSLLFCLRFIVFFYCLRPVSCAPNVVSVSSVLSKVYCFFHCLRPRN
jgi:hypothetical protein